MVTLLMLLLLWTEKQEDQEALDLSHLKTLMMHVLLLKSYMTLNLTIESLLWQKHSSDPEMVEGKEEEDTVVGEAVDEDFVVVVVEVEDVVVAAMEVAATAAEVVVVMVREGVVGMAAHMAAHTVEVVDARVKIQALVTLDIAPMIKEDLEIGSQLAMS